MERYKICVNWLPTDLHKENLFSIWSHTDPTDLSKLAYGVTQTSHRPCKVLPQTPQTFKKNIYLVYGVTQTPQTFQNQHIESHRPHTDLAKFYHRPHRPSKISRLSLTDLTQTLQSSTTDPTDLQKEYLFSIWSHTDHTDLSKLAY